MGGGKGQSPHLYRRFPNPDFRRIRVTHLSELHPKGFQVMR